MKPIHALLIALTLAVVAVIGVTAVTKTSTLGASAKHASAAAIAARAHKLDSFEAALQKALKNKPPALPKVPAVGGAAPVLASSAPGSAIAPRVVYRRPAPIIIHKHSTHGDDGYESSASAGGEGGGGND